VYPSLEAIVADEEVDLVINLTIHSAHVEVITTCLHVCMRVSMCIGYLEHPFEKEIASDYHHPPLSRGQVGLSHRNCREMVLIYQRNQASLASRSSGKAYKGFRRCPPT